MHPWEEAWPVSQFDVDWAASGALAMEEKQCDWPVGDPDSWMALAVIKRFRSITVFSTQEFYKADNIIDNISIFWKK